MNADGAVASLPVWGFSLTSGNKCTMDLPNIKITYVVIHQFACFHGHKITTTRHEDYEI
jgi:hypothetical protein